LLRDLFWERKKWNNKVKNPRDTICEAKTDVKEKKGS